MNSVDPNVNAILTNLSNLLKVFGGLLAANGFASSGLYFWSQLIAGAILVIGPAIWDTWNAIQNLRKAKAVGVAAGINLVHSGSAVSQDGESITSVGAPDAVPPKPVTLASADEIVKNFAPDPSTIAKK